MNELYDIDDILGLFGISDSDIETKWTIKEAIQENEISPIKTKRIKYFDEEEKVWKIGEVIVNSSEKPNNSMERSSE